MINLKGKTILVTGASAGIGSAVAKLCSDLGAKVCITGRNIDRLIEVSKQLSIESEFFQADLTLEKDIDDLVKALPSIDGWVHCAGIIEPFPIKYIQVKHIDTMFSVNFNSACLLISKLMQHKKVNNASSFVFMSSVSALHPYNGGSLYAASKAALESFSRSIALEFASKGVRSNCISAALVDTEMFEKTKNALSETELLGILSSYPLGIGKPMDVAHASAFLLSDQASWMTGSVLTLDGGLLLNSKK
ncbi:MAG: SDR family oxidoreductase [Crocinitomicaceae bacterium]|nr:SDR family oxidoreductase [Crocinitomicaceae bacterium]